MTEQACKKKKKRRINKVPVILQMEALECGAACLTMILSYYGCWAPLEEVRSACGISRDGSKASKILKAARFYGLEAAGYRMDVEHLAQLKETPAIIYWENRHFVVFNGYKNGRYYITDPGNGKVSYKEEDFVEFYSGVCLTFSPTDALKPRKNEKTFWGLLKERLSDNKVFLALVLVITVIVAALGAVVPFFDKFFYEQVLDGDQKSKTIAFFMGFLLFSVATVICSAAAANFYYRMRGKLDAKGNTLFVKKIFRLPFEFFSQRMKGDIVMRKSATAAVTRTLVETAGPLLVNIAMMILYFALMFQISPEMAIICVVSAVLCIIFIQLSQERRTGALQLALRDSSIAYSKCMNGIELIETLKAHGAEKAFMEDWTVVQKKAVKRKNQTIILEGSATIVPQIIFKLAEIAILGFGVLLILKGSFTLGILAQFQGFMASFFVPAATLMDAGKMLLGTRADIERIDDVLKNPNDRLIDKALKLNEEASKLKGDISIRNMTFGYSAFDPPNLTNINIDIKAGECVAFVGTSGSGKSTIAKLLGGLYEPWEGEILYDGKHIEDIPRSIYTRSLMIADQEITLFSDTVRNNIKLWDDTIEDFEMILAARDAGIHESILSKPEGYDYVINKNQQGFSGGEKQRIEIARVLAADPTVAIFDEATSALDAITEYKVMDAIRQRGITCIFIAHRLSTIRDCDRIFVLDHGQVVEAGTHEELYALGGVYTTLIADQEADRGVV